MRLKYLFSLLRTVGLPGLLPIMLDWRGVLRFHFLYAAIESGLLEAQRTPGSGIDLRERLGSKRPEMLAALLKVDVAAKELHYKNGQYHIKGKRSRAMIGEYGDMLSAVVQANVTYYNSAYQQAADRMQGAPLGEDLNDAGDIVARFSKLSEPVMQSFFSDMNMQGKANDAAAANLNMVNASLKGVTPLPDPGELR